MGEYIGLDVSLKETAISVRRDGKRVRRGKCLSDPAVIAALIRKHANDADGLAHLAEVGFFREVRVKGFDSMLSRTLIAARTKLVRATLDIASQIRGLMKTFGLIVPRGIGAKFERNVRSLLTDHVPLAQIILPLLEAVARPTHPGY